MSRWAFVASGLLLVAAAGAAPAGGAAPAVHSARARNAAPAGRAATKPTSAGCSLTSTHTQTPGSIALGATVHVEVQVTVRCGGPIAQRFILAAPAWPTSAEADQVRAALDAFVDANPEVAEIGLALGNTEEPQEIVPTTSRDALHAALANRYGPAGAGSAEAYLINSGRAMLYETSLEETHDHIVILDHAAVPRASDARLKFDVEATLDLGIEITHVCVGGGCVQMEGVEEIDVASLGDLAAALTPVALRPSPTGLRRVTVRQSLGPAVDYMFPSANIAPSSMATGSDGNFIAWEVPELQDAMLFTFDVRPFAVGPVDVVGDLDFSGMDAAGSEPVDTEPALPPVDVHLDPVQTSSCHLLGEARAEPGEVRFHAAVTETIALATDCAPTPRDADVVLAFDTSSSMQGLPQDSILEAARRFVQRIDLTRSRVSVMMFADQVDVRTAFTSDENALLAALQPMDFYGDTAIGRAIDASRTILDGRRTGALPVMVLLTDGRVRDDPVPAAAWAHAAGIRIALVCFSPALNCDDQVFDIASSQYLFFARDGSELIQAYDTLGSYIAQPDIERLSVSQVPVDALPFRSSPPPKNPPSTGPNGEWVWNRADPLASESHLEVPLRAEGIGEWPVAESITAYWLDNTGAVGAATVPVPRVNVVPPPETGACQSWSTRDAAPTSVRAGDPVTVTTRLDVACDPGEAPLDVVFAIDHSFSMGTLGRLDNAVLAVEAFLDEVSQVRQVEAWSGLVAFNEQITHRVPVGPDQSQVVTVLHSLAPSGSTDIGRAIDAAVEALQAGRPGAQKALVIVTDGDNSPTGVPILEAAGRAKEAGILLVAVCAGGRCGADLADAASGPQYYTDVTDPTDMSEVFARLAKVLAGLRPAALWVDEHLASTFDFVEGVPEPTVVPGPAPNVQWAFGAQPDDGQIFHHVIRPHRPGRWPVALWSEVQYTLHGGVYGTFYLPAPVVEVNGGAPPAFPTTGPVATATPSPTAPPPVQLVYLPVAVAR